MSIIITDGNLVEKTYGHVLEVKIEKKTPNIHMIRDLVGKTEKNHEKAVQLFIGGHLS